MFEGVNARTDADSSHFLLPHREQLKKLHVNIKRVIRGGAM